MYLCILLTTLHPFISDISRNGLQLQKTNEYWQLSHFHTQKKIPNFLHITKSHKEFVKLCLHSSQRRSIHFDDFFIDRNVCGHQRQTDIRWDAWCQPLLYSSSSSLCLTFLLSGFQTESNLCAIGFCGLQFRVKQVLGVRFNLGHGHAGNLFGVSDSVRQ